MSTNIIRQSPRAWKPFWRIPRGDAFYIGKKQFLKTGLLTARAFATYAETAEEWGKQTPWQFVNPFRRFRTTVYLKKALNYQPQACAASCCDETPKA